MNANESSEQNLDAIFWHNIRFTCGLYKKKDNEFRLNTHKKQQQQQTTPTYQDFFYMNKLPKPSGDSNPLESIWIAGVPSQADQTEVGLHETGRCPGILSYCKQ